ncbi:MAG: shikimate kinase [Deltaproteobacteria bacterium]|nr:shikimate kinase [Deltaproteobacteria bacterium]
MKNIVLTGFMGTGKSSVGRRLARELHLKFIDTDGLIEKEAGINTNGIFEKFGEAYFREMESKVINEISTRRDMVIATGGGAIVNQQNLEALKRNGIVICLTASIDAILSRVGSGDERPLLSRGDKKEAISNLLKQREPFYKKADFIIDTTTKTVGEVVEEIKEKLLAMGDRQ